MMKTILALLALSSIANAAELTIQIKSGSNICSYRALHERGTGPLLTHVFEDTWSARLSIAVSPVASNGKDCLDYDFIEVKVNESIYTSNDVKTANQLVRVLSASSVTNLTVDAADIKNGEPTSYAIHSSNLDGSNASVKHVVRIDRTYINLMKFKEGESLYRQTQSL